MVPLEDVNLALECLGLRPLTEDEAADRVDAIQVALDRYASTVERCCLCGGLTRSSPGFAGPYCIHLGVA